VSRRNRWRAAAATLTHTVTLASDTASMDNPPSLQPGSQVRCPRCRRWHDVIAVHTEGTAYTIAMRYWECRGQRYYAGQEGGAARYSTRTVTGRVLPSLAP
jgi:hypothetical protein